MNKENSIKTLDDLNREYDKLQLKFGAKNLKSIYNGGCDFKPSLFFVFMNPTARNIASAPEWSGIRAPWIGTKQIWDLFYLIDKFNNTLHDKIKKMKASEWTPDFALSVYDEIHRNRIFISNFAKCTQDDARKVSDQVYKEYLPLLFEEIRLVKPCKIVLFGNQVSSLFLGRSIAVSQNRKKMYLKTFDNIDIPCYPVYYPVGNGRMNIDKAVEDLKWIIRQPEDNIC